MSISYPIVVKATDSLGHSASKSLTMILYNQGFDPASNTDGTVLFSDDFTKVTLEISGTTNTPVLAAAPIAGKKYWETEIQGVNADYTGAGIAEGSQPLGSYVGASNYGCGIYSGTRALYRGNSVIRNFADASMPRIEKFKHAFDSATRRYWVGLVGGAWLIGDPATGTSPATTMPGGTYYPAVTLADGGKYIILRSAAADFEDVPPSGFSGF